MPFILFCSIINITITNEFKESYMFEKKFDFYSPINLKSYNLDLIIRYQLDILGKLDPFTKRHSENVANLCCRLCE